MGKSETKKDSDAKSGDDEAVKANPKKNRRRVLKRSKTKSNEENNDKKIVKKSKKKKANRVCIDEATDGETDDTPHVKVEKKSRKRRRANLEFGLKMKPSTGTKRMRLHKNVWFKVGRGDEKRGWIRAMEDDQVLIRYYPNSDDKKKTVDEWVNKTSTKITIMQKGE